MTLADLSCPSSDEIEKILRGIGYKVYLFDNSSEELTMIAEIQEDSSMIIHINSIRVPNWFKRYVLNHYS